MIKSSLLGLNRPNQITSLSPTQICTVFQASHGRTRQTSVCCFHTKLGVLSPYHDLSNIYRTRSSDTTLKQTPIQNQHCFWALKWRMHQGSTCKNTVMDSLLYQSQSPGLSLQGESSMLKSGKYSYHRQCASSNLWFSWELCNHWNMFQGDRGLWPTSNMVQTICHTSFQEVARPMHLQLLLPIGIKKVIFIFYNKCFP